MLRWPDALGRYPGEELSAPEVYPGAFFGGSIRDLFLAPVEETMIFIHSLLNTALAKMYTCIFIMFDDDNLFDMKLTEIKCVTKIIILNTFE